MNENNENVRECENYVQEHDIQTILKNGIVQVTLFNLLH